jgi:hypothetical protein
LADLIEPRARKEENISTKKRLEIVLRGCRNRPFLWSFGQHGIDLEEAYHNKIPPGHPMYGSPPEPEFEPEPEPEPQPEPQSPLRSHMTGGDKRRKYKKHKTKKRRSKKYRSKKKRSKKKRRKTRKTRNQRGGDKLEYLVPTVGWVSGDITYNIDGSMTVNGNNIKCGSYYEHGHGWAVDQPDGRILYFRPLDPSNMTDLLTNWGC